MPKVDYDAAYTSQIDNNQQRMLNEIKQGSDEIKQKISSRIGMYRLETTVDEVLRDLQTKIEGTLTPADIISISEWAAVKPERQNLHEKAALAGLQSTYGESVKKLPTRGENAVFFSEGEIFSTKQDTDSKSIDFLLNFTDSRKNTWKIFMGHKFTQNAGGKQTQQNVEPDRDMRNAPKADRVLFISIKDGKGAEETLSKSVERYEVPGKIYACKIDDVEEIIDEVCNKNNPHFSLIGKYSTK